MPTSTPSAPSTTLEDVQASADLRNLPIQRVGVKAICHPVQVQTSTSVQASVAYIDMYVGLPADQKGTHMSRFLEVLQEHDAPLDYASAQQLMHTMLHRLEADSGYIEMRFPFFVNKTAPVSGVKSLLDYQVTLKIEQKNDTFVLTQVVQVPVTSLCPCSKKISSYGAHNQRSHITIHAELRQAVAIEDLITIAESSASCQLWGLLKRPDEKYVTEYAYDNPKFVEDLVRDVALALTQDARIQAYIVESENFESIHNHSAYALIEHRKSA
jgi:GTP cyclohydrolase I